MGAEWVIPESRPPMAQAIYFGLCTTFHDPAFAAVSEGGEVLFAEAIERPLQYKRGLDVPPDPVNLVLPWLERYGKGHGRWIVALNWRERRPWYEPLSRLLGYFLPERLKRPGWSRFLNALERYKNFHMLACQSVAMARGGLGLLRRALERFPEVEIEVRRYPHPLCHAAYGCLSSPFEEAACLVVDGYSERGAVTAYHYRRGRLVEIYEDRSHASLGFFYALLTELCGFDWLKGEEWKVMGLSAYGQPDEELYQTFAEMLWVEGLGIRQDLEAIERHVPKLRWLYREARRDPLTAADLAATGQQFFTDRLDELLQNLHQKIRLPSLVLVGGCALNALANGQIVKNTPFERLHVPSAPADDGTAVGAAWLAFLEDRPEVDLLPKWLEPYLGSAFDREALDRACRYSGLPVERLGEEPLCRRVAGLLAEGKIVGWLQGRAEFGPRALGNRSLLADPRRPEMKARLNREVKFREPFRPFAPSILDERGKEYFEGYQVSPYMERALPFRPAVRERVPAVVHLDGTGRLQSVRKAWNPRFYRLISEFERLTGVPLLLNTSYNVMGKPIVHSVEDALAVFTTSGIDALVIEDRLFLKPHAV